MKVFKIIACGPYVEIRNVGIILKPVHSNMKICSKVDGISQDQFKCSALMATLVNRQVLFSGELVTSKKFACASFCQ
jgi:hypothetical protein